MAVDALPPEISPCEARERQSAGALLVDVREAGEQALGMARDALALPGSMLADRAAILLPRRDADVLLICARGRRSLLAADTLRALGYARVTSVAGGMARWQAEGLPLAGEAESPRFLDRYARHLLLPEVGLDGQRRLRDAKVALVGAGGLGSPIALYLAAAGVGQLALIDDDRVERSNLQRQVLHGEADIGRPKVDSAVDRLRALNPDIALRPIDARLSAANVEALLAGHDVVVDGADNFATRYLISDACVRLGMPMVYGAVQRFHGQVAVFWRGRPAAPGSCYRCLFPEPPPPEFAPNCAEAGVLGVLPGLIGLLQATEALKLLLGIGEPLVDTLLRVDALGMRFDRIGLSRDPGCPACGDHPRLSGYEDLPVGCAAP
jgi:molybdopterin/thiamine biosynthesis adenylyltransferase/rhodanese-related sulfurtransferase